MSYFTGIEYLLYSKNNNTSVIDEFEEQMLNMGFRIYSKRRIYLNTILKYSFLKAMKC